MPLLQITPTVFALSLGFVNCYLIRGAELTLVDTGIPGSETAILQALGELGQQPGELKHIIVTHLHMDHSGGLAALKRATGAAAYMHPADAAAVRIGQAGRPVAPRPGAPPQTIEMVNRFRDNPPQIEPTAIEYEITETDTLPFLPGARIVHLPGHAAGQIGLLLPDDGGILIAADAARHTEGLEYPPIFEDIELGIASLQKASRLEFAIAAFGHGTPLPQDASNQFRAKWG